MTRRSVASAASLPIAWAVARAENGRRQSFSRRCRDRASRRSRVPHRRRRQSAILRLHPGDSVPTRQPLDELATASTALFLGVARRAGPHPRSPARAGDGRSQAAAPGRARSSGEAVASAVRPCAIEEVDARVRPSLWGDERWARALAQGDRSFEQPLASCSVAASGGTGRDLPVRSTSAIAG